MKEINRIIPMHFRPYYEKSAIDMDKLQEIRFRIGQMVELFDGDKKILCKEKVCHGDIKEMLEYISGYSLYAFEDELAQGFITIPGGHRVGVAGQVVVKGGQVVNIRNISFVNIRMSHEIIGCSKKVMTYITDEIGLHNTLVISPPRSGKTTLLRDVARIVSGKAEDKKGKNVVIVDERSEIAGCFCGVPQNDVGEHTDVLDRCPKSVGMMMAVRALSPDVIVADEIGTSADVQAIQIAANCGCTILASVHGRSMEEIRQKPEISKLILNKVFERYIVLGCSGSPGHVKSILNEEGEVLYCD